MLVSRSMAVIALELHPPLLSIFAGQAHPQGHITVTGLCEAESHVVHACYSTGPQPGLCSQRLVCTREPQHNGCCRMGISIARGPELCPMVQQQQCWLTWPTHATCRAAAATKPWVTVISGECKLLVGGTGWFGFATDTNHQGTQHNRLPLCLYTTLFGQTNPADKLRCVPDADVCWLVACEPQQNSQADSLPSPSCSPSVGYMGLRTTRQAAGNQCKCF